MDCLLAKCTSIARLIPSGLANGAPSTSVQAFLVYQRLSLQSWRNLDPSTALLCGECSLTLLALFPPCNERCAFPRLAKDPRFLRLPTAGTYADDAIVNLVMEVSGGMSALRFVFSS